MEWYVIGTDGTIVFNCPDDTKGEEHVLDFILEDMKEEDTDLEDYLVFRGEHYEVFPPKEKHVLRRAVVV